MQFFLFGMVALAAMLLFMPRVAAINVAVLARSMSWAGGLGTLMIGVTMLLRGWVFAGIWLTGFGAFLLMRLLQPWTWAQWQGRSSTNRRVSHVTTEHLNVELEHETGVMRGQVLKGFFVGRDLETLRPVELAHLWADCQFADPQSAQILEAYLDRVHPTWRDDMARTSRAQGSTGGRQSGRNDGNDGRGGRRQADGAQADNGQFDDAAFDDGRMTQHEALDILGLQAGASEEQIRQAHRALMLKLHPDRGGSHILAAKVNEAKDVLLG